MKILAISDVPSKALWDFFDKSRLEGVDLILSCGDLPAAYLSFLVTLGPCPVFYVPGNHDKGYLNKPPEGCVCVDDQIVEYNGVRILGLGGSMRYNSSTYQYTEKEMEKRIRKLRHKIRKAKGVDIVVTHAPIRGYGDLPDYAHQGFACFEKLLRELQPKFWLYGHVHLRYDHRLERTIQEKETKIINCYDKTEIRY